MFLLYCINVFFLVMKLHHKVISAFIGDLDFMVMRGSFSINKTVS